MTIERWQKACQCVIDERSISICQRVLPIRRGSRRNVYVHEYRPSLLRGSNELWLFPGEAGGHKDAKTLSCQIKNVAALEIGSTFRGIDYTANAPDQADAAWKLSRHLAPASSPTILGGSCSGGVAVREFATASGPVDYALFVDMRFCGVVEAKPAGTTLSGFSSKRRVTSPMPLAVVLALVYVGHFGSVQDLKNSRCPLTTC